MFEALDGWKEGRVGGEQVRRGMKEYIKVEGKGRDMQDVEHKVPPALRE